jgi:hypothetical protein
LNRFVHFIPDSRAINLRRKCCRFCSNDTSQKDEQKGTVGSIQYFFNILLISEYDAFLKKRLRKLMTKLEIRLWQLNLLETTFHNPTFGYKCDQCDFVAKSGSSLKTHKTRKHT